LSTSLLVTAQHSEPYRKIGRMHVLYNFSLVGMVILDLQICLEELGTEYIQFFVRISGTPYSCCDFVPAAAVHS